jgi:Tol biopolymer transport system component
MRTRVLAVWISCSAATAAMAAPRPFTADTMWTIKRVGVPLLSPDGTQAVYSLNTYDSEENRLLADLWMVPVAGGTPRRLTAHKASDGTPDFSPDGTRLVFVSKRDTDKAAQLYLLPFAGGEAERLTDMPMDVATPRFLADGKRIVFASHVIAGAESPEETKKALEAREKNKVKARATESRLFRFWDRWLTDEEYPHLFVLDLETHKVTDLLPGSKRLFGLQGGDATFDVSPDGSMVAFEANSSEAPYPVLNTDIFVVPTAGGAVRNLTAANPAQDTDPVWSPDGKTLAYGLEKKAEGWPDRARLGLLDVASGRSTVLTEAFDAVAGGWQWSSDGSQIVFTAEMRGRVNVYAIPSAGGTVREGPSRSTCGAGGDATARSCSSATTSAARQTGAANSTGRLPLPHDTNDGWWRTRWSAGCAS